MSKRNKKESAPRISVSIEDASVNVTISPKQLSAILSMADKSGSRPHLAGVYVEYDGAVSWLCATDGHAAMRIALDNPGNCKADRMFASTNTCKLAIATGKLSALGESCITMSNEQMPPSLAQVFPANRDAKGYAGFDMALVSRTMKAMADAGVGGAYFKVLGEYDAAIVESPSHAPRVEALIMPMRLK